ncbi:methylmalonyl-CoA epimerase [Rhodococcus hoagii]|nr:methylmalonyl-CoA epimerase [Prescottella equi]
MTSSSPSTAPSGLTSELVTAIDHVGIAVPDLDAAIAWYGKHLGMVSLHEEVNEEQGVREAMLGYPGQVAGATAIQLLAPLNENSTIAKFIDRSGPGLQQLAFRVTDIDAISAQLRADGVRLLYDAPRRGTANSRINFIHPKDGGGVLIELVEPAADGGH